MPNDDNGVESANTQVAQLERFEIQDERVVAGDKLPSMKSKFLKRFIDEKKIEARDSEVHLGTVLYAFATRTTSEKASRPNEPFITYTVRGLSYSITEGEIRSWVNSLAELAGMKNKIRVFCRSLSEEYLNFCRANASTLPLQIRCSKVGIPAEVHYLQADFLVGNSKLTEHEQAVMLRGREGSLNNPALEDSKVTSLYDLGKSRNH
ncbi:ORF7 [Cnidium closterovirus 1]|nr:ORF7 [Cnidium closterovirus 1]